MITGNDKLIQMLIFIILPDLSSPSGEATEPSQDGEGWELGSER